MARPGSGAWAAAEFQSAGQRHRMGTARLQPGVTVTVLKEAIPAFEAIGHIMTTFGYRLRQKDTGGYANRNTASGRPSPHKTGTAVDFNWNTNPATGGPYGGANRLKTDMPMPMVNAILGIRTRSGHQVFGWGGHFSSFKDAMHFEVKAGRAALASGLDPATTKGYTGGPTAGWQPGPSNGGGTGGAMPRPSLSTEGEGVKPRGPAPKETAPPPTAALTRTVEGPLDLGMTTATGLAQLTVVSASLARSITEPSSLTVIYADHDHEARRLPVWEAAPSIIVDRVRYTLTKLDADTRTLTGVFVEHPAWQLQQHRWTDTTRPTQTGGAGKRGDFIRAICAKVIPGVPVDIQPGQTALVDLAGEAGETAWETLRQVCDDVKWRLFVDNGRLVAGADEWLAQRTDPIEVVDHDPGVHDITWSLVFGLPVSEASITADIARWSAPPSQAVVLKGEGPANGSWLVEQVGRDLLLPRVTVQLMRAEQALEEAAPPPAPSDTPAPSPGSGGGFGGAEYAPRPLPPVAGGQGGGTVAPPPAGGGRQGWTFPVVGHRHVTSKFGYRIHPVTGKKRLHAGVDLKAPTGTRIVAAKPGTVVFAGTKGGYGNCVDINHGGTVTRYAHLSKITARVGQSVTGGQQVGLAGATGQVTGPHLHFELRPGGGSPVDPWPTIKNAPSVK